MGTDDATKDDIAPGSWQPLSARRGGTPIDETWQEGIPAWIDKPIRKWLYYQLISSRTRDRLFARLHFNTDDDRFDESIVESLNLVRLLNWIDGVLHITAEENRRSKEIAAEHGIRVESDAEKLGSALREGHSIWRVSDTFEALERRQDATVTAASPSGR